MIVGIIEKTSWYQNIYPEELQAYLDLGWVLAKPNSPNKHPFIDGCTVRWDGEEIGPRPND